MRRPRALMFLTAVVALLLVTSPALARERAGAVGKTANCGLSGTWYGYNSHGDSLLTITRLGRGHYSVVFDANHTEAVPPAKATTDWRGELKKIGGKKYRFTSMAYLPLEDGLGVPMAMGVCTLTTKQTQCDTFKSRGSCAYFGFFPGQDPFVDGFPLAEPEKLRNRFWRLRTSVE